MKLKDLFGPFHPGNIQDTCRMLREWDDWPEKIKPFVYDREKHFHILKEMTKSMRTMPSILHITQDIPILSKIEKHGKHVGDLDMFPIFHYQEGESEYYGIVQDNKAVSYVYVIKGHWPHSYGWHNAFTLDKYRKQQHIKRLLYFIKSKLGYRIYDASGQQTSGGIKLVQSIGKDKRFKVSWLNMRTGEKVEYNPITDHDEHQPYRTREEHPTDWRILIESIGPCRQRIMFYTRKLTGRVRGGIGMLDSNAINGDLFNFDDNTTYEEIKGNLSFCFDKERQRRII